MQYLSVKYAPTESGGALAGGDRDVGRLTFLSSLIQDIDQRRAVVDKNGEFLLITEEVDELDATTQALVASSLARANVVRSGDGATGSMLACDPWDKIYEYFGHIDDAREIVEALREILDNSVCDVRWWGARLFIPKIYAERLRETIDDEFAKLFSSILAFAATLSMPANILSLLLFSLGGMSYCKTLAKWIDVENNAPNATGIKFELLFWIVPTVDATNYDFEKLIV